MSNTKSIDSELTTDNEVGPTDLLADIKSLKDEIKEAQENNNCMRKTLRDYRLFVDGLTRAATKDESFYAMMSWNPELVYKIAGQLDSPAKAKRFLFGS